LHDYLRSLPQRYASTGKNIAADRDRIKVTDDWPEQVPIGDAEPSSIKGHMRQELDKLLGPLS
jgi:hypothetical protein